MQDGAGTLAEWLAAGARERRTFSLLVTTDEGMGRIYLSSGEVVHAVFGHLVGEDAVQAILAAPGVEFEAVLEPRRSATPPPFPKTVALLPPVSEQRFSTPPMAAARARSTPPSQRLPILAHSTPAPPVSIEPRRNKALPFAALAGVLALGALTGFALNTFGDTLMGTKAATTAARPAPTVAAAPAPKAAASVARPAPPASSSSSAPASSASSSPAPSASVPTVVLRLVVGADGRPSSARVASSSLDPKLFEQAALAAAKRLEFRPALRAGVPIAAEIDWPVTFEPDITPATLAAKR